MDIRKLRIVSASAALVVAGLGISRQAHGQIAMNGTIDPAFGTPLAYNLVPSSANGEAQANGGYTGAPGAGNTTGFADGTDIEGSYATIRANSQGQPCLYMFFSGNLSSGLFFDQTPPGATGSSPLGDFLNLFIQTGTGGRNTLGGAPAFTGDAKYNHMVGTANPITFDSSFTPNYRFALQEVGGTKTGGGNPGETTTSDFNLFGYFGNLNTGVELNEGNTNAAGGTPAPLHARGANGGSAEGINFNLNNSNTVGVTGSTAPSQAAQAAIATGVVVQIPLADITEAGQPIVAGAPIKIGYLTMQGNNNPQPAYADDIQNQMTNLAPGYIDNTGSATATNNTTIANGNLSLSSTDATKSSNTGNSLNENNQPGGQHYFIINNVPNLTWNNAGGSGSGLTWDAAVQNFNNGAAPAVYTDSSLVTFNDSNNSNYNVGLNTTVTPGSVTVNSSSNYTFSGTGTIAGAGAFVNLGTGTTTLSTINSYTGGTSASQGTLVIGVAGALPANSKVTIGTMGLESGIGIQATSGIMILAPNTGGETLSSLTINGANPALGNNTPSTLDITNNHVFLNYGSGPDPIGAIAAEIASGFNAMGTPWTGTGITSSAAAANSGSYGIGYADSADPGNPAGLPAGTVEIKYTLLGDANLDGSVNGSDFAILATNFNKAVSGWDAGDFNYDGAANGADFALLASNFNQGASQADVDSFTLSNGLTADVPEPASLGLAAAGIVSLLGRRRRRN